MNPPYPTALIGIKKVFSRWIDKVPGKPITTGNLLTGNIDSPPLGKTSE